MTGATTGGVRKLLRAEGASVLAAGLLLYARSTVGWGVFVLFFLAPDLSFFGYLAGERIGAVAYNAAHSYLGPIACIAVGGMLVAPAFSAAGLLWAAHVGFDRMLGYGMKYAVGFGYTHLGRIGRSTNAGSPPPSSA